ncbi:hypothetical protein AC578_6835 [Pseudocercospora eumusae]|uniref:BTB domain-containing protein n=1 Tax=Pseudocercospora eumusae TaxID=321146 RepID=A0A139H752_9PEZI|nr:hypothetical protein AC578_6835 [Pseudocercospora eumusae]
MAQPSKFDRAEAEKDLLKILADPDITIKCNGKATLCHKHILCRRSDWFAKAITSGFLESSSPVIELKEESDELAVRRMLEFCYSLDYSAPEGVELLVHVQMVRLADKYFVHGLVAFATDRFQTALKAASQADLAAAVEDVYATRSSAVHDLRGSIVDHVLSNEKYLGLPNADFDQLLCNVPELAVDLSRTQYNIIHSLLRSNTTIHTRGGRGRGGGRGGRMLEQGWGRDRTAVSASQH